MNQIRTFLVFLILTFNKLILAGPSNGGSDCSTYCAPSRVLRLNPGTSYEYRYSGQAHTSVSGGAEALGGLSINASVSLTALSPCELIMQVSHVQISGGGGLQHAAELAREPVRASLQGGRIETLCASPTSSPLQAWALNVKRGILSQLQVSLRSTPQESGTVTLHETDVNGKCRADYHYNTEANWTLVTRTKDLTLCSGRSKNSDIRAFHLNPSIPSSKPLLRGEQTCTVGLQDHVIKKVSCEEKHIFWPFSRGDSAAMTHVQQELVLVSSFPGSDETHRRSFTPSSYRRTSLLYEHEAEREDVTSSDTALDDAAALLRDLARDAAVHSDSATKFSQLLHLLRQLSKPHLLFLATGFEDSETVREMVLRALPTLDTVAATETMATLYATRSVQDPHTHAWLTHNTAKWFASLAFSRHASEDMLSATQELLHQLQEGRVATADSTGLILGVSGLAHELCRKLGGPTECANNHAIRSTVTALENVADQQQHAARIVAIKGLGNIGIVSAHAERVLTTLYQDTQANTELRLAAIDAFRRTPCSDNSLFVSSALQIYQNTAEDSEVRIAAYLALIRCPTPALIRAVKRALYTETVNQVGSFVWTHLTNSQESSSKSRQALRAMLANDFLQNKFRTDARQFSRNFEASRYFESLGVGANVDANLVFSTKSYLPRSAMLDLTVDIFGESANLFELGARAEGLEPFVERLLSRYHKPKESSGQTTEREDLQLNAIRNLTKSLKQDSSPHASAYVRVFNNEVLYADLSDMLHTLQSFDLSPSLLMKHLLSRKEHTFSRSLEVVDTTYQVPTGLGIPLKLALNGTARVNLVTYAKFDSALTGLEMSGKFAPSANVALTGTMSMGSDDFAQGIRFEALLYTNTTLDTRMKVSYDGTFNLQTEMPSEKQTLIEMKSERFSFNGDAVARIPDLHEGRMSFSECSGDAVDQWLGIRLCAETSFPKASTLGPAFPLNGDSHVNITITKTDPTFNKYDISTSWTAVSGRKYDFGLSYNRLGSVLVGRRRAVQVLFDRDGGLARLTLDVPEKQAELALSWDSKGWSAAELRATWDRALLVAARAQLRHVAKTGLAGKYEPELSLKVTGWPEVRVGGMVNYVGDSKVSLELRMDGLTRQAVRLAVDYANDPTTGGTDCRLSVDSEWITWDMKAGVKMTASTSSVRLGGVYNLTAHTHHTADVTAKYTWSSHGALSRFYLNLRAQLSQAPQLSGQLTAEVMTSRGYYEAAVRASLREQEWNITQRAQNSGSRDMWFSTTVTCPQRAIDFKAEHRHKLSDHSFSTTTRLHVDKARQLHAHLDAKQIAGDGISFITNSSILWPGLTFSDGKGPYFDSRLYQTTPGRYLGHIQTQWNEKRSPFYVNATYLDATTLTALNHQLRVQLMGAAGFTKQQPLIIQGELRAAHGSWHAQAALLYGVEEKAKISGSYEMEMQVRHKINLTAEFAKTRRYEVAFTGVNEEEGMEASLDLIMSRHISLAFKVAKGRLRSSFFWDKALRPDRNVTLAVDMKQADGYEVRSALTVPGQHVHLDVAWSPQQLRQRPGVPMSLRAALSWLPGKALSVDARYVNSSTNGLEASAELQTKNLPVFGDSKRRVTVHYWPGSSVSKANAVYAWEARDGGEEHITCEVSAATKKSHGRLNAQLRLSSSLWDTKEATIKFARTFKNWGQFDGEVSGQWGDAGTALQWDWQTGTLLRLATKSNWTRVPSCGVELRLSAVDAVDPQILKHRLKAYYEDRLWEGVVALKSYKDERSEHFNTVVDVSTPETEHSLTLTATRDSSAISLVAHVITPLLGDYAVQLNGTKPEPYSVDASFLVLTADTTLLQLHVQLDRNDWEKNRVAIAALVPGVANVETELRLINTAVERTLQFSFKNDRTLLHKLAITWSHERQGEDVSCNAYFTVYTYLLLPTAWTLDLLHAGTKANHTTYVHINDFSLDHTFIYDTPGHWNFSLTGTTPTPVFTIQLSHEHSTRLSYNITIMETDVIDMQADVENGFLDLHLLDSVLSVNSKFSYDDELFTETSVSYKLQELATLRTQSYAKFDESEALESLVVSANAQAGSDSATFALNMVRGGQITSSLQLAWATHALSAQLDLFTSNNSVKLLYKNENRVICSLDASLKLSTTSVSFRVSAMNRPNKYLFTCDVALDHASQAATLKAVLDGDFLYGYASSVFPLTVTGALLLDEHKFTVNVLDVQQQGVSVSGHYAWTALHKQLSVRGHMPNYNDEFVLLDLWTKSGDDATSFSATYEKKRFKYHAFVSKSSNVLEASLQTPFPGYTNLALKMGHNSKDRMVLEMVKDGYSINSEVLVVGPPDHVHMVWLAKSSEGLDLEASFGRRVWRDATDCRLVARLNGRRVEAGALVEFRRGSLNITANVTQGGETARLKTAIFHSSKMLAIAISSEFREAVSSLRVYSGTKGGSLEQGFMLQALGHRLDVSSVRGPQFAQAKLTFTNPAFECVLDASLRPGEVTVSQATSRTASKLHFTYDVDRKVESSLTVIFNEPLPASKLSLEENAKSVLEKAQPLYMKILYDWTLGRAHFNVKYSEVSHLVHASYVTNSDGAMASFAAETPFFENINGNFNYIQPQKTIGLYLNYGLNFCDFYSSVTLDGPQITSSNFEFKSSVPYLKNLMIRSQFEEQTGLVLNMKYHTDYFLVVKFEPKSSLLAKFEAPSGEYEIKYQYLGDENQMVMKVDGQVVMNVTLRLVAGNLQGTVITPYEKYRNLTVNIGLGENVPSKSLQIYSNNVLLMKAHMYPIDDHDMHSGTGIMATFFKDDEKMVYDAQFSIDNPVYVTLKQLETQNGTRDILKFNLNVTDEFTAIGEAFISLPISSDTKVFARGHVQVQRDNAQFKVTYRVNEETEKNFLIDYKKFTDALSSYNIVVNISTPFDGYESMFLTVQSSLTETVVNFVSPFDGYENIRIVSVHRLTGDDKELHVQYQNMKQRIFYLKALFKNEPKNKVVDLEARSPFLNGQVLVYSNVSMMGIKIEQDHVTLAEISSRFEQLKSGYKYKFLFTKPGRTVRLSANLKLEQTKEFKLITTLDDERVVHVDVTLTRSGNIAATINLPNGLNFDVSGDADWKENTLQLSVIGANFTADVNFAIKSTGHLVVKSKLLQDQFAMTWSINASSCNFNLSSGPGLNIAFHSNDKFIESALTTHGKTYSFFFGESEIKCVPNLRVNLIWNSESKIDFQHLFVMDGPITQITTKLHSPFLGTHKNMKFEVTLKTKDEVSVEAEFKWRPKDITMFKAQFKIEKLNSVAMVEFKSPFSTDFLFNSSYDFTKDVKHIQVYYKLTEVIQIIGLMGSRGPEKTVNITFVSPIQGYRYVSLVASHAHIIAQHDVTVKFKREALDSQMQVTLTNKYVKVTISTPNRRMLLTGDYDFNYQTHSITGAFQWGKITDVMKFNVMYKPSEHLHLAIETPSDSYKITYDSEWSSHKMTTALLLERNDVSTGFSYELAIKDHLYMLVASVKSLFETDLVKMSLYLNLNSGELRGAVQVTTSNGEKSYSVKAVRVTKEKYSLVLTGEDNELVKLDVTLRGQIDQGMYLVAVASDSTLRKLQLSGKLMHDEVNTHASLGLSWDDAQSVEYMYKNNASAVDMHVRVDTTRLPGYEGSVRLTPESFSLYLRQQSESFRTRVNFLLDSEYSVNTTINYNDREYAILTYCDPTKTKASLGINWPKNQNAKFAIALPPGELSFSLATSFAEIKNLAVVTKYSEQSENNIYKLTTVTMFSINEVHAEIQGDIHSYHEDYGLTAAVRLANQDTYSLKYNILRNRALVLDLTTPLKGLPQIYAKLEKLKSGKLTTGIHGEIKTPFMKLPHLNFTFNRVDQRIEAQFSFDTATYKNVSIHTKFSTQNANRLYIHMNTPFISQVKFISIDGQSEKQPRGLNTKILISIDKNFYELRNNYTISNGRLVSNVYLTDSKSQPIEFKFGGKFHLNTLSEIDVEAFYNVDTVAFKFMILPETSMLAGKIFLPSMQLWTTPSNFELTVQKNDVFEAKLNYKHGGYAGNALVKNKITGNALETVMYLNLPRVFKYPLQLELNAHYISPKLQFTGYASYSGEHRLHLTMVQNFFRTTLDAHLDSAFLKGTKKFSLSFGTDTLSVSMDDEIQITGVKKANHLVLTLSQLHKKQDHVLTYSWELLRMPKFEVTLESPMLTAKKATFSATYLGLTQGVNLKLNSGNESMRLDYGLINQHSSKGVKIVLGNSDTQVLSFAATLVKITNGNELIADLHLLDLNYKCRFNYTLRQKKLAAALQLHTPYLFPMKRLLVVVDADMGSSKRFNANVTFGEETVAFASFLRNQSLSINVQSTSSLLPSGHVVANYRWAGEVQIMDARLVTNDVAVVCANLSITTRPHSITLESFLNADIDGFEELRVTLTMPSDLKYSLTANLELLGDKPFKAHLILTSRTEYTNLDLVTTGLWANIHLTPNQGDFSYKSGSDDYRFTISLQPVDYEVHSQLIVNSGTSELFKAGLRVTCQNDTACSVLVTIKSVFEQVKNVAFHIDAKNGQLRFGAEHESSRMQRYVATISHHMVSLFDLDVGLSLESSEHEPFIVRFTHVNKPDSYVVLAQINKSIVRLSAVRQDESLLGTGTLKLDDFTYEVSGQWLSTTSGHGLDVTVTLADKLTHHVDGKYNYGEKLLKADFNLDSYLTGQVGFDLQLEPPEVLYLRVDRNHIERLKIDFVPLKARRIFVNLADVIFTLTELRQDNVRYNISSSIVIKGVHYDAVYNLTRETPDSYECNLHVILPTRTINIEHVHLTSAKRTCRSTHVAWQVKHERVGYLYDMQTDEGATKLEMGVEIPNRAMQFTLIKTNTDSRTEYGAQFNWNSKRHQTPMTAIAYRVKHSTYEHVYVTLAHPVFNSSLIIFGQVRRFSGNDMQYSSRIGTVSEGVESPFLSAILNVSQEDGAAQYGVSLLQPHTDLDHSFGVYVNRTDGILVRVSTSDVANNNHAAATLRYVRSKSRLDLDVTAQELEMSLGGQLDVDDMNWRYGVSLLGSYDPLSDPLTFDAHVQSLGLEKAQLTVELSVAQDRSYLALLNVAPSDVSAQLLHNEYGASLHALHMAVTLNDSKVLAIRGRYRSDVWANITHDLAAPYERATFTAAQIATQLQAMLREDFFNRVSNLTASVSLSESGKLMLDHSINQWTKLLADVAALPRRVDQAYNSDAFFLRSIVRFSQDALLQSKQVLSQGLRRTFESTWFLLTQTVPRAFVQLYQATLQPLVQASPKLTQNLAHLSRDALNTWRKVRVAAEDTYTNTVNYTVGVVRDVQKVATENAATLSNWVTETGEWVTQDLVNPTLTSLTELATAISQLLTDINDLVVQLPLQVQAYVLSLEETQALLSVYKEFASWLEELRFSDILDSFREDFLIWYSGLLSELRTHLADNAQFVLVFFDDMSVTLDQVMNSPHVLYVKKVHSRIMNKLTWLYAHYRVDQQLEHLLITLSDHLLRLLLTWAEDTEQQLSLLSQESDSDLFSYNATSGDFAAAVPLLFTWRRFDRAPELDVDLATKFSKLRYSMVDRMYGMAAESSGWQDALYRTLLPPFSASALITGTGNVITFDGHHFKIVDQLCGSYLLAADYDDQRFAVVVTYGSQGLLKSVTMLGKTGQRLDIGLDTQARPKHDEDGYSGISINGNKVELPADADNLIVRREGQLVVAAAGDVTLRCSVVALHCSLELPGWFHGRVAGLAGLYDRERGNDVSTLVQQWRLNVDSNCSYVPVKTAKLRVRESAACRLLFQSGESALQPCFKRLDPEPFRRMCDLEPEPGSNRATGLGRECATAEAYVAQCRFFGMELSLPPNCVRCHLADGRVLSAGDVTIYDAAPDSRFPTPPSLADVVFLLERPAHNVMCVPPSDLADLPAKLEAVLRVTAGINSSRFALLSFGAGHQPALHTHEGLIWGSTRTFQQTLKSLELGSTEDEATDRDLLNALLAAVSKLSFRAGASKSVVLVPCSSCTRSRETSDVFAEATSLLLEADVKIHIVQRQELTFKRNLKRQPVSQGSASPVMGVDREGAYTGRRVKGTSLPRPSKAIMRQLSTPKDLCTPLALETNGTLFSAGRLRSQDSTSKQFSVGKRKWLDVWSRRVASSSKPTPCQTCDCLSYTDGSSRVSCQACVSPTIKDFMQEWEEYLEQMEEWGDEKGEEEHSSEEETETLSLAALREMEIERQVLNRMKDMLLSGQAMPLDL